MRELTEEGGILWDMWMDMILSDPEMAKDVFVSEQAEAEYRAKRAAGLKAN